MSEELETVQTLVVGMLAGAVILAIVGGMVVFAGRRPFPASIVVSLTILATLALIGYAVGGEARGELAAIAGTAVGALAGATTAMVTGRDDPPAVEPHAAGDEED